MKNLQEATERICELKGNVVALDAACSALVQQLPPASRQQFQRAFEGFAEMARTSMLNAAISEHSIAAFEVDVARIGSLVEALERQESPASPPARDRAVVESLLLAVPRVSTFDGPRALTVASGFFFEREDRLYLVTSRHVLIDEPSKHFPDRIEIVMHTDQADMSRTSVFSLLLYENGKAAWHQA
ncbi:MAG: serine protease, partial [Rubrivivax sp.]|nr:serine protease [Rubrivivax sp.]